MELVPWLIGTLGAVCLTATVAGFAGAYWGFNFARNLADAAPNREPDTLLVPKVVTDEQIANILAAQTQKHSPPETPRPYRVPAIPGID